MNNNININNNENDNENDNKEKVYNKIDDKYIRDVYLINLADGIIKQLKDYLDNTDEDNEGKIEQIDACIEMGTSFEIHCRTLYHIVELIKSYNYNEYDCVKKADYLMKKYYQTYFVEHLLNQLNILKSNLINS